ncbi:hypothetical protein LzC2_21250 [Planctomycetes bacterium LzC2]|uniref:Uncharacterized protein n=2 Tax=Alienimonas chondri TaxID=2681879 RepID=A0ABX1VF52_9PLAN|nr:hypothetical protein [Alienimonas chondri]
MRRFADRIGDRLNAPEQPADPREAARQKQFEAMLKALQARRGNRSAMRQGSEIEGDDLNEIGPRDLPVPPEFEDLYQSYRRSIGRTAGE